MTLKRISVQKVLHLIKLMENVAHFFDNEAPNAKAYGYSPAYYTGMAEGVRRCIRELREMVQETTP